MRNTTLLLVFLLSFVIFHPYTAVAQPNTKNPSICEYQEKRNPLPINPKTNKPYTPDERNQEPFAGASISKDEIRQCLQAETPIKNHHIVFENYRDAWQELAKETGDYAISIKIEGGILQANTSMQTDGIISLGEFRDPSVTKESDLTEEQRKAFEIPDQYTDSSIIRTKIISRPIKLIRAKIELRNISINSIVHDIQDFGVVFFSNKVEFIGCNFNKISSFDYSIFDNNTLFHKSKFNNNITFDFTIFTNEVSFLQTISDGIMAFGGTIFKKRAVFFSCKFELSYFHGAIFLEDVSFSNSIVRGANFVNTVYSGHVSFNNVRFISSTVWFKNAVFNREVSFNESSFNSVEFIYSQFESNADFRNMTVAGTLNFDNTTWKGRIDLRGISAKHLHWDNTQNPSSVKDTLDFREAYIGSAILKEVRFQDFVDFSRTTFGTYKADLGRFLDVLELVNADFIEFSTQVLINSLSPYAVFENNTFEREADFLHVKFHTPVIFINNRFHTTLDLTDNTFEAHKARLCLSYNRVNRLVFASEHLGNVQRIDAPECQINTISNNPSDVTKKAAEPLPGIYKSLERAFKDANDQRGVNEAWYLAEVVQNDQRVNWGKKTLKKTPNLFSGKTLAAVWSIVWGTLRWLGGDIPSRYAVDVWRTVWVSIGIMIVFYFVYLLVLRRSARNSNPNHWTLYFSEHPERPGTFRFRLFEPIHSKDVLSQRVIIPWRDAALLSIRSYLKLGLGTRYPHTQPLTALIYVEWALGVFMLIHFILAVRNNLPFILPFLGVVN